MGRTQSFDTVDAVRAARAVFWAQGFEEASLPDLERATGLNRSSIYHAFGSKRALFDAAVESYLDEVVRPRLAPLRASSVEPGALADYLTALRSSLQAVGSLPASSGCLLINTAGSPIGSDATVAHTIAEYRAELAAAFGRGVDAAHAGASESARTRLADACTGLVIAAFALVRVDPLAADRSILTALQLVAPPVG